MPEIENEILCKLYLELAQVVPRGCQSARDLRLKRIADRLGLALRMIAEGCDDPRGYAREILLKVESEGGPHA